MDELKDVLQSVWDELSRDCVDKAVLSFVKRLYKHAPKLMADALTMLRDKLCCFKQANSTYQNQMSCLLGRATGISEGLIKRCCNFC